MCRPDPGLSYDPFRSPSSFFGSSTEYTLLKTNHIINAHKRATANAMRAITSHHPTPPYFPNIHSIGTPYSTPNAAVVTLVKFRRSSR
jgi:hypothetical protein